MPTSILEDSDSLKKGGKSTLLLLFALGITILIYFATKYDGFITWLKTERAGEVSEEFIPLKPGELSFLLPSTTPPRTTVEKNERKENIIKNMNYWHNQLSTRRESKDGSAKEVEDLGNPETLINNAVKVGLVHPREAKALLKEAYYFNLYIDESNTWKEMIAEENPKKEVGSEPLGATKTLGEPNP